MKTFAINTLGCKINQYESQQIRELLEQLGLRQLDASEKSDLVVINTCCVTHTASAKSRQYIRKSQRLNPNAVIVVCGCLPTVQIGELGIATQGLHLAKNQDDLVAQLRRIAGETVITPEPQDHQICPNNSIRPETSRKIKPKKHLMTPPNLAKLRSLPMLNCFKGHTRAFLKVQGGCDGYCSYCIVPKTRPFVHSKPIKAVLQEAGALVDAGHREIVVTGIFLGAYGRPSVRRKNWPNGQNDKLPDLLDKLAEIPGLARIRLSSLEPGDVTPRLLDTFSEHRNIMPHLHLSLQSGSNAVLKKMCRQYTADEFRQKIQSIKARLDRPAITTDIIVGFPGETDDDFEQTVQMAKDVGFAKMHIFSFSPRKGTAAAAMQDVVNTTVMRERSRSLHDLNAQLGARFREQFVGETAEILTESNNGQVCGRSERYFMVWVDQVSRNKSKNELLTVKLMRNREDGLSGLLEK